jgi:hypothetical protein
MRDDRIVPPVVRGRVPLRAMKRRYGIANVTWLLGAVACGSSSAVDAAAPPSQDAGPPDVVPSDATDAGTPACDAGFARAHVRGLVAPSFEGKPGDADPGGIAVFYNGTEVAGSAMRSFDVPLCAGDATVEVRSVASGASIGRSDWNPSPNTTIDKGAWAGYVFPERLIVAYGEPGSYKLDVVPARFDAPSGGRWRFHVLNGLTQDTFSARLVPYDPTKGEIVDPTTDPYEQLVASHVPSKSSLVVEIDHPIWHDLAAPQKHVALQYWADSAPDVRGMLQMMVPTKATPVETPVGSSNWPDGTVATLVIQPNFVAVLDAFYFVCRDPLWSTTDPRCTQ